MPNRPDVHDWIQYTIAGGEDILSYAMRRFFAAHPGIEEKEQSVAETLHQFADFWNALFRQNAPSYITATQTGIGIVLQDGHQVHIPSNQPQTMPDVQAVQIIHP